MQDASSRLSERINWATIQFLLENSVFLLIGLQVRWIVADVAGPTSAGRTDRRRSALAVLVAVILVLRPIWVFPVRFLADPSRSRPGRARPVLAHHGDLSWAGMRGVVTLAAVFVAARGHVPSGRSWSSSPCGHRRHAAAAGLHAAVAGPRLGCADPTRARTRCRRPPSCCPRSSAGLRRTRRVRTTRSTSRRSDMLRPPRASSASTSSGSGWAAPTRRRRRRASPTGGCAPQMLAAERARGAAHPRRRARPTTRCSRR